MASATLFSYAGGQEGRILRKRDGFLRKRL